MLAAGPQQIVFASDNSSKVINSSTPSGKINNPDALVKRLSYPFRFEKTTLPIGSGNIKKIACGLNHTLILTESGVFSAGCNQYGQLARDEFIMSGSRFFGPVKIDFKMREHVMHVACGNFHSVVATSYGHLCRIFVAGDNYFNQIGLEDLRRERTLSFKLLELNFEAFPNFEKPKTQGVKGLACGPYWTAVAFNNSIVTFGHFGPDGWAVQPTHRVFNYIKVDEDKEITHIACSDYELYYITKDSASNHSIFRVDFQGLYSALVIQEKKNCHYKIIDGKFIANIELQPGETVTGLAAAGNRCIISTSDARLCRIVGSNLYPWVDVRQAEEWQIGRSMNSKDGESAQSGHTQKTYIACSQLSDFMLTIDDGTTAPGETRACLYTHYLGDVMGRSPEKYLFETIKKSLRLSSDPSMIDKIFRRTKAVPTEAGILPIQLFKEFVANFSIEGDDDFLENFFKPWCGYILELKSDAAIAYQDRLVRHEFRKFSQKFISAAAKNPQIRFNTRRQYSAMAAAYILMLVKDYHHYRYPEVPASLTPKQTPPLHCLPASVCKIGGRRNANEFPLAVGALDQASDGGVNEILNFKNLILETCCERPYCVHTARKLKALIPQSALNVNPIQRERALAFVASRAHIPASSTQRPDSDIWVAITNCGVFEEQSPWKKMQSYILLLEQHVKVYGGKDATIIGDFEPINNADDSPACPFPIFRRKRDGELLGFFWHGTKTGNVDSIELNGFQDSRSQHQLYGPGTYFAIEACKSLQFSGKGGIMPLLLCAVFLGKAPIYPRPMHKNDVWTSAISNTETISSIAIPDFSDKGKQKHFEIVAGENQIVPLTSIKNAEGGGQIRQCVVM